MGSPSDKKRSARRPGKRERARIKTGRDHGRGKSSITVCGKSGLGGETFHAVYGRKKASRVYGFVRKLEEAKSHLGGEPGKAESGPKC
jgi:hypothetical protein